MPNDQLLQAAAALIGHHHVDRLVGSKKVEHSNHIGMQYPGQRPAFFEEALQAVLIGAEIFGQHSRDQLACAPCDQRAGQVFLECNRRAVCIVSQVDDRKTAAGDLSYNAVATDLKAFRKRCIGLGRHKDAIVMNSTASSPASSGPATGRSSDRVGLHSMTGYGSALIDHELGRLGIELRSVNSRYLEIAFRLPDELRMLEPLLREALSARIARGKIDCRASVQHRTALRPELRFRPGMLEAISQAQVQVHRQFPEAVPMSVADLLRFPGLLEDPQPDPSQWINAFRPLISTAIDELIDSRSREGHRLAEVIRDRAHLMSQLASMHREHIPQMLQAFSHRLTERLREAASGGLQGSAIPLDEAMARIRQEVSLHGIKADVAEELARLDIHIEEVLRVVDQGGQVGKRLDFLMQELNREANTLGSKAAGLQTTTASIDLKLLIEQIREQVQNLE